MKEGICAQTIHRFFHSVKDVNEDTGEEYFIMVNNSDPRDCDLIIVDECSMVNEQMYQFFRVINKPIIFVGDRHQIMPVKEDVSPVFSLERTFTFTKNMRIKNNPDSMSAMYLKQFREAVDNIKLKIRVDRRPTEFMLEYFEKDCDCVVLAWTNKQVSYWSDLIRRHIFHSDKPEKFYVGEKLVYSGFRRMYSPKGDDILHYYSSDIITISEIQEESIFINFKKCRCEFQKSNPEKVLKCDKCGIKGHSVSGYLLDFYKLIDNNGVPWFQVKQKDAAKLSTILNEFKNYCLIQKNKFIWVDYYTLKEAYKADLKYSYSSTVHKAQGSQYGIVFVDIGNIRMNRNIEECSRLSYTAVSRFTDYVYFI
jgi:hypothetical protein